MKNDMVATVVPVCADYQEVGSTAKAQRVRDHTRLSEGDFLDLDNSLGLFPNCSKVQRLWTRLQRKKVGPAS
jgi:hypothetical protein